MKGGDTSPIPSSKGSELINRLIMLYEESDSWSTKGEINSLTVCPGLYKISVDNDGSRIVQIKWRINETRKHAALVRPGKPLDVPRVNRKKLDPVKVDHFIDFVSSPNYLQNVAYGTKTIKLTNGEAFEIPSVVRNVTSSRLVNLYFSFCQEVTFEPLARSTLFGILKVSTLRAIVRPIYIP